MTLHRLWPLGLLALALASTGCDTGRKNPPNATVRVLNVAPSFGALTYRREQVVLTNPPVPLLYQGSASGSSAGSIELSYDEDTYSFTASARDPATLADVDRDSFTKKIVTGTLYTFVFLETGGNITHTILESPRVPSDAAKAQVQATHADEGLPSVDLYLEVIGTGIAGATPWGTIGFKESLASREVPPGVYELTITEAGNPANVLLKTQAFTLDAPLSSTLVLSPDAGEGIAPFDVVLLSPGGAITLVDPSLPAMVRALNGALDQVPRDVAFNGQFSPPLFSAAAFAAPTAYQPLAAAASVPVNVTPVGNPGVLELTGAVDLIPSRVYTAFFTGEAGTLGLTFQQDDRRRLADAAKITFYGAHTLQSPEILVLAPGTDPNTAAGQQQPSVVTPGTISAIAIAPGTYEIWLRVFNADFTAVTIVGGPVTVTVAARKLYGVVTSDNANGTTIDMTLIDDFL